MDPHQSGERGPQLHTNDPPLKPGTIKIDMQVELYQA